MEDMMKRTILAICLVYSLTGLMFFFPIKNWGQSKQNDLKDKLIELHLQNVTLLYALSTLSVDYQIPIGFEKSLSDKDEQKINLEIVDGKLQDVLDSIIKQEPQYKWEINDGVVNFIPVNNRDVFLERLLDTHINKFAPKIGNEYFRLKEAIADLPEIKTLLETNNIILYKSEMFSKGLLRNIDVDINIQNTNVKGVLNNLVKETPAKFWKIERTGEKREYLLVSF